MANEYLTDKCDDIKRGVSTMVLQLHDITENGEQVVENQQEIKQSNDKIEDLLIEVTQNHSKDHEAVESRLKQISKNQTRIKKKADKEARKMKSRFARMKRKYDGTADFVKLNTKSKMNAQDITAIQTQVRLELIPVKEKMERNHDEAKQMFRLMLQRDDQILSALKQNFEPINEKLCDLKRKHDQMEISSMAARKDHILKEYHVSRFVDNIRKDLLCSICQEVPKNARLCRNKDHIFCFAHISQHLHETSLTCPVCRDSLTLETLRRPAGFLKNYLDDLKIKCDHCDRGCPDVVRLEDLLRHVDRCGFAPVMCGNEGCGMVVNKSEKENHEKSCRLGIAKLGNQGEMGGKFIKSSPFGKKFRVKLPPTPRKFIKPSSMEREEPVCQIQSDGSSDTEETQKLEKDDEKSE